MTAKRLLIHSIFLLLLPIVIAWFEISVAGAIVLVVFALAWRWINAYPNATGFIRRLYEQERQR